NARVPAGLSIFRKRVNDRIVRRQIPRAEVLRERLVHVFARALDAIFIMFAATLAVFRDGLHEWLVGRQVQRAIVVGHRFVEVGARALYSLFGVSNLGAHASYLAGFNLIVTQRETSPT